MPSQKKRTQRVECPYAYLRGPLGPDERAEARAQGFGGAGGEGDGADGGWRVGVVGDEVGNTGG
jgi:hypothetical protein